MNPIYEVFRKEMREMIRDKRVRSGVFIMPIFVIMLMMSLFGFISSSLSENKKQKVHIVKTSNPLVNEVRKKFDVVEVADEATGVQLIKDGKAQLLAEFPDKANASGQETITLRYDEKEQKSTIVKSQFIQAFAPAIQARVGAVLMQANLDLSVLKLIDFKDQPVKVGEGPGANGFIVGFLPYMIVLFAFTGGFSIASDMVAGEKEKNTLETLLIAPVKRLQVVLGKFFALSLVCLASSLNALLGLVLSSTFKLPGSEIMFSTGLGITLKAVLLILVMLLPLVAFFASTLVAVSSYARNMREAQTYLGLLNLVVIIPAVFSQVIGFTDYGQQLWINFIPILNTANGIRMALLGKAQLAPVLITVGLSTVLAAVALQVAIYLFKREQVLVRV